MKKMYQFLLLLAFANFLTLNTFANVELSHFDVTTDKGNVTIEWTSLSELNCEFFVIERSLRFNHWKELTKIEAQGTLTSGYSYKYKDYKVPKGNMDYTYRISEMDESGNKVVLESAEIYVPNYISNVNDQDVTFSDNNQQEVISNRNFSETVCDLKDLNVEKKGTNIQLSWMTSNEENCYYFIIERKIGDNSWTNIHTTQAMGGVNSTARYDMVESVPSYDLIKYQVKVSGLNETYIRLGGIQIDLTNDKIDQTGEEELPGRSGAASVDMTDFNTSKKSGTAHFEFTTENEQNCHVFTISRSIDRNNWESVDMTRANGATSNKYHMRDLNMLDEAAFYRLQVEDVNGNATTVTELQMTPTDLEGISVYPNPANEIIFIEANDGIGQVTITLSDLDGNVIVIANEQLPGRNTIDVSDLKEGIYVVKLSDQKNVITKKIVIDR